MDSPSKDADGMVEMPKSNEDISTSSDVDDDGGAVGDGDTSGFLEFSCCWMSMATKGGERAETGRF